MESFDFIFAGAGCAGLSLVHYLLESDLKDAKILLIDPRGDTIPNKTWCYWAEKPLDIHPRNHIQSWNNLSFIAGRTKITKSLGKLNYFHLNSHDFYKSIFQKLAKQPNVKFIQDEVLELIDIADSVQVQTKNGGNYRAAQIFDSRLTEHDFDSRSLKQVFTGWRIKTEKAVFDPSSVVLMEFPSSNTNQFEFFYILPFSTTEALVEYTTYSQKNIPEDLLKNRLENHLKENLGDSCFKITFQESGIIPMSTRMESVSENKRIVKIGTAAGWTKASTGYTFYSIQQNCKVISQALKLGKVENLRFTKTQRFVFYDNILLNIAHKWPERLQDLFLNFFNTSSAEVVLRFLSEETTVNEELKLLSKLQFPIFIKSLLNYEAH